MWWPDLASFDVAAFVLSCLAGFALLRLHLGMAKTLAFCAALGIIWKSLLPLM
jgi:hypothetical protein